MIAWASKFFGGIKVWLYAAGAALLVALFGYAKLEEHGKRKAQDDLAAHEAEQKAADAQAAKQTYMDASDAVTKVQQDAAKQPAPDTDKRNDFDTNF